MPTAANPSIKPQPHVDLAISDSLFKADGHVPTMLMISNDRSRQAYTAVIVLADDPEHVLASVDFDDDVSSKRAQAQAREWLDRIVERTHCQASFMGPFRVDKLGSRFGAFAPVTIQAVWRMQ